MGFFTKIPLNNIQTKQLSGDTLTLSGNTQIASSGSLNIVGDLILDGKQIVATGTTGTSLGHVLTLDNDGIIKLLPSTGSGGTGFYNLDSPPTVTVGGITPSYTLTGKPLDVILRDMLVPYVAPTFTAFGVTGQALTVEVGTPLSGSRTFTWTTSNSGNVQTNSVGIRNVTTNTLLGSGLANDGNEVLAITPITLSSNGATQAWRAEAVNTNAVPFNSSNVTVTARFLRFHGPRASSVANSTQVRSLPVANQFQTANANTFTLNTGNALTKFIVALPPGRTIASVFDLDALNANITSEYILVNTIAVLDNAGSGPTSHLYNIYEMNVGVPYSSNHRHEITTA